MTPFNQDHEQDGYDKRQWIRKKTKIHLLNKGHTSVSRAMFYAKVCPCILNRLMKRIFRCLVL